MRREAAGAESRPWLPLSPLERPVERPLERPRTWGHDVLGGVRAMVPWMLGIGPYGLVIGVSAAHADIPTAAGWFTGPAIFSPAAPRWPRSSCSTPAPPR